ncbi:MAG TPA: CSLREA domain-containing protein, partial [Candidatus Tectomicrobia bacterium]
MHKQSVLASHLSSKAISRRLSAVFAPIMTAILLLSWLAWSHSTVAAQTIYIVNSTADPGDGVCDDTECTLREAINAANANIGPEEIHFNIPPGSGPHSIQPGPFLPPITDPVVIDGYTQPGAAPNTNPPTLGTNAVLRIVLDGTNAGGGGAGLSIRAGGSGSTVRGLVINRFSNTGILLEVNAANNVIEGNFIGTDVTGTLSPPVGTLDTMVRGLFIVNAPDNLIGGTTPAARNLISGQTPISVVDGAISIFGVGATGNRVEGNLIGTNASGAAALGDFGIGVRIEQGASNNTVGGTLAGARNVIAGHQSHGIEVGDFIDLGTEGNVVQGNFIGTDVTGTIALGNSQHGVSIVNSASNIIGGTAAGAGNVISGNGLDGVLISGGGATGNVVEGNFIGTDLSGTADLGNGFNGLHIIESPSNTVGGTTAAARNVISGNSGEGVRIDGTGATGNVVQGNYIGTDVSGTADLGNTLSGVYIRRAPGNSVIGNVVSGNDGFAGIALCGNPGGFCGGGDIGNQSSDAAGNVVQGNLIGTDATGSAALGNSERGVSIDGAPNALVGGTTPAERNVISANGQYGVYIFSAGASGNQILGNYIGTDSSGLISLGNGIHGVVIVNGPNANVI